MAEPEEMAITMILAATVVVAQAGLPVVTAAVAAVIPAAVPVVVSLLAAVAAVALLILAQTRLMQQLFKPAMAR